MRGKLIAAVLGLLAVGGVVRGQTSVAETTIVVPEVEVRSGPTLKYYPTSKLRQGDRVVVVREVKDQPGWLAILPPRGSFSWVNGKYVRQPKGGDPRLGYVEADAANPVPVMPGSSLVNQEPNVEGAKIVAGTIVTIVNPPLKAPDGQTWLPIQPHPSEVRYIPASAVKPPTQVATQKAPNWTLTPGNAFTTNPKIAEAEQAVKAGNLEQAKKLFQEAADRATDQNQKAYSLNRISTLTRGYPTPGHPAQVASGQGQLPVKSTSFSPSAAPGGPVQTAAARWSSYGFLRQTAFDVKGQPMYVLVNAQGQPLVYVSSATGTTLRQYVGRVISVYGPEVYNGDSAARRPYILASHVALP